MFGKLSKQHNILDANEMPDHDDEMYYEPFKYLHLGSLAYIGNSYVTSSPATLLYRTMDVVLCPEEKSLADWVVLSSTIMDIHSLVVYWQCTLGDRKSNLPSPPSSYILL